MVDTRDLKSLAYCKRVGSSPTFGTECGSSSVGRAQPCQGWGREFESRFPLNCRDVARNVSTCFKRFLFNFLFPNLLPPAEPFFDLAVVTEVDESF